MLTYNNILVGLLIYFSICIYIFCTHSIIYLLYYLSYNLLKYTVMYLYFLYFSYYSCVLSMLIFILLYSINLFKQAIRETVLYIFILFSFVVKLPRLRYLQMNIFAATSCDGEVVNLIIVVNNN